MIRASALSLLAALLLWPASAPDAETITECDRLANHPSDPNKLTPGIAQADVDTAEAKRACASALAADHGNGRLLYQLGRAHFYEGDYERGPTLILQSADTGYAQGQFVYGLILSGGYIGDVDYCQVGRWWLKAAHQNHFWAQIYLIDAEIENLFVDCRLNLSEQIMIQYLENLRSIARDPRFDDPRRIEAVERLAGLLDDTPGGAD